MTNQTDVQLGGVAETLLIPLYFRAKETQRPDALVRDEQAVALVKQLDYDFSKIKLREHDKVAIILRLREFDRFARDFLNQCPDAVVVHIGCGLDTRFQRVPITAGWNGMTWICRRSLICAGSSSAAKASAIICWLARCSTARGWTPSACIAPAPFSLWPKQY